MLMHRGLLFGVTLVGIIVFSTYSVTTGKELADAEMESVHGGACGIVCLPSGTACPTSDTETYLKAIYKLFVGHFPTTLTYDGSCVEIKYNCIVQVSSWCVETTPACSRSLTNVFMTDGTNVMTFGSVGCYGSRPDC